MTDRATPCRVRVTRPLDEVFPEYRPQVGGIYDAMYKAGGPNIGVGSAHVCIITVKDKKICLRPGEYEILEEGRP